MIEINLPMEWSVTTLDQMTQKRGASVDPAKFPSETFELYSVPSFDTGSPERVTGSQIGSTKQLVEPQSVLLCKINPRINRVWVVNDRAAHRQIASTEWIVFPDNGCIDPKFLCFYLQKGSVRDFLAQNVSGVGGSLMRVKASTLRGHPFPVAPLNEQRRIVEKIERLFAQLDKAEEALRDVQKLLTRYRQSVLKTAVAGHPTEGGTNGWKCVVLETLLEDIRYGTAKKCRPGAEGTAILRIPNVVNGEIDLQDLKFTHLDEREFEKLALKKGDLLIVRSNGSANLVGRGAVVDEEAVGLAFAGYLIRLRVDQKRLLPGFLQLVLNSPVLRAKIERQARSTSGVHNINSAEIKAITFLLPPIDVQATIVESVEEYMNKVRHLETWCQTELARSTALRQSILKDAFSGRLVPQDPNDEPAAGLVARIKETHAAASGKKRQELRGK